MSSGPPTPSRVLALAGRRVLVVDDQPSIRGVLRVALGEAGALVSEAADGESALQEVERDIPEVLLLDLAMPGMDGWEVLLRLRQSPRTASIPVVVETSDEDYASYQRARNLGVAAFVSKPFRLGQLVETCRRIVEGARPLQGRGERAPGNQGVRVLRAGGEAIEGQLVEMDHRGAQVVIPRPLTVGERVALTFGSEGVADVPQAEVRWATAESDAFRLGLVFR